MDGSGGRTVTSWAITELSLPPQGLALLEFTDFGDTQDAYLTHQMANYIAAVFQGLGSPSFRGLVLTSERGTPARKIASWIQHSVTDFYIHSHGIVAANVAGAAKATYWRDMVFWPSGIGPPNGSYHGYVNLSINGLLGGPGGREYNFAFCDFCGSAGGAAAAQVPDLPGAQDFTWANAFNIARPGVDPYDDHGTFWGWDGDIRTFTLPVTDLASNWYWWDHYFWFWLGPPDQLEVRDAAYSATRDTLRLGINDTLNPWDLVNGYYRAQMFGDPFGRIP